ncbi:hypothetical protein QBC44DRAFT_358733 [Cladorrhinum sp. PSN332]|nr:hypothetical protein QBC44DRAFT_358733 [Cladorrhinum sp. PSN332]
MWVVNKRSSASASSVGPSSSSPSTSSSSRFPFSHPPVVAYHLYSHSHSHSHHHHRHQQEEYLDCQSTGSSTTMEGSYNYTELEMIKSSRVRVVRSQLSLIKSAVTSRLSPGWWIGGGPASPPSAEEDEGGPIAVTSSSDAQPLSRSMHVHEEEMEPRVREISTTTSQSRPTPPPPLPARPVERTGWERDSGVDWRFAGHGMSMIVDAESKSDVPELERSKYISGVRDMLRGLPPDLTTAEASWIVSQKLPKTLSELTAPHPPHSSHPSSSSPSSHLLPLPPPPSSSSNDRASLLPSAPGQKNLVHQLALPILEATRTFLLWIGPIVWGYLRYVCEEFVRLEKEHHWGEKVVWPRALWMLNWLCGVLIWLGNVFPGQTVFEVFEYVKRGLVSALREFVAEVGERERKEKEKVKGKDKGDGINVQGLLVGLGQMGMEMGMGQQRRQGVTA